MSTIAPPARLCLACQKPLVRRPKESPSWFARRVTCGHACSRPLHKGRGSGYKMRKQEVPCSRGCGAVLLRAVHLRDALCHRCERKERNAYDSKVGKRLREQARRYRILLAVGPYREWEELLRAVRIRNPRSGAARYDLAMERRSA